MPALPMLLRHLAFLLIVSASALAQIVYDAAHNATPIQGSWSSGSRKVITGSTYVKPADMSFTYPPNTGISISFAEGVQDWYEYVAYRNYGNGSYPNCPVVVITWHHGKPEFVSNGSIVLHPIEGFQRVQDPCAANSDFTEIFNLTTLFVEWRIFQDATDGPKLHLNAFDGTALPPMFLQSASPEMLPTQALLNISKSTTPIRIASGALLVHWWNVAAVATVGAVLCSAFFV